VAILVVVLLKVDFEKQIFLNHSVAFSFVMIFLVILTIQDEPTFRIGLSQIFEADFKNAFIKIISLSFGRLVLNGVVVVVLGVLLEGVVIAYHTVSPHPLSVLIFIVVFRVNKHGFVNLISQLFGAL